MHWYLRVALAVVFFAPALSAQSNICEPPAPSVPNESRAQLAQIQAEERARHSMERANWTASILPVKYATTPSALNPLCIFGIEVVPQPTMKLIAIRAPKELMPAIEEALKRLDVPAPISKSLELTAYIVVVSENPEQGLQAIPSVLQPVANQLKTVLPSGNLYLADTVVVRGIDGQQISVNGATSLYVNATIRDGADQVVHLERLGVQTNGARFDTNVDVPVGAQVVVGRATAPPSGPSTKKAVVLVITAKILN